MASVPDTRYYLYKYKGGVRYASGHYSGNPSDETRRGRRSDKFIVHKGSKAKKQFSKSLSQSRKRIRKKLLDQKILVDLVDTGSDLKLTQDYEFNSPSEAASILLGGNYSGNKEWRKDDQGNTLRNNEGNAQVRSFPNLLQRFEEKVCNLPSTKAEQLVRRRIGQEILREALIDYWGCNAPSPASAIKIC